MAGCTGLRRVLKLPPRASADEPHCRWSIKLTDARVDYATEPGEYVEKHGFPFIIAVRDHDKASIMAAFQRRIGNDRETEFAAACRQLERIAEFRLIDKFAS